MEHTLDPLVVALVDSLEERDGAAVFHEEGLATARRKLRAAPAGDKRRLALDLLAYAAKLQRLGGAATEPARGSLAQLVLELLGDTAESRDLFAQAGLARDRAAALGGEAGLRAPRADDKPAPPAVKAARGLKKT